MVSLGVLMALVLLGVVVLRQRVLVVTVDGVSMTPTLQPGDRVLARRRIASSVRRGEIVVVTEPGPCRRDDPTGSRNARLVVKRVAAIAGDPQPSYLPAWARWPTGVVPAGYLVVLGDNAQVSRDSRHVGAVPAERVLGVVTRRLGRQGSPDYRVFDLPHGGPDLLAGREGGRIGGA
jgi:signal peptidase I